MKYLNAFGVRNTEHNIAKFNNKKCKLRSGFHYDIIDLFCLPEWCLLNCTKERIKDIKIQEINRTPEN